MASFETTLEDVDDRIQELRSVGNRSAHPVFRRLLAILEGPPFLELLQPHLENFSFEQWWAARAATFHAQPGTATLEWPDDMGERIAARGGVCRMAAATERGFLEFAYLFLGVSGNFDDRLHQFIDAVVVPLRQDLQRMAERRPLFPDMYAARLASVKPAPVTRAFISYSTVDKKTAGQVKRVLEEFGIESFLAHEDIRVSEEWRARILAELARMDLFVALFSEAFRKSDWTAQETGYAIARRDVLIIPVLLDETIPFGFLNALQGRRVPDQMTKSFFTETLFEKIPRVVVGHFIHMLASSGSFRKAERHFEELLPFLDRLTAEEATAVAVVSTNNSEIWDAGLCRVEYIPRFLSANKHQLPADVLEKLERTIEPDA